MLKDSTKVLLSCDYWWQYHRNTSPTTSHYLTVITRFTVKSENSMMLTFTNQDAGCDEFQQMEPDSSNACSTPLPLVDYLSSSSVSPPVQGDSGSSCPPDLLLSPPWCPSWIWTQSHSTASPASCAWTRRSSLFTLELVPPCQRARCHRCRPSSQRWRETTAHCCFTRCKTAAHWCRHCQSCSSERSLQHFLLILSSALPAASLQSVTTPPTSRYFCYWF